MSDDRRLKNRVKLLRSRLSLSQSDLAREVGITRQSIISIEKGKLNPSIVVCLKIARVLREPVDYVFYLERPLDATADPVSTVDAAADEEPDDAQPPIAAKGKPNASDPNKGIWDFV